MTVQKVAAETGNAGRQAGRPGPNPAAEQASLAALTTTLIAGAVTGAVAGVMEARQAPAQHESARDRAASPDDTPLAPGRSATTDAADPARPAEPEPLAQPRARDAAADAVETGGVPTPAAADVPAFATAGTTTESEVASHGTAEGGIGAAAPAAAEMASAPPAATPAAETNGGQALAPAGVDTQPAQSAAGPGQPGPLPDLAEAVTSAIDQALARLDADLGAIADSLPAQPQELAAALAETTGDAASAIVVQATGQLDALSDRIDETLSASVDTLRAATDALPAALAIPVTLLGAEAEDKPADGLLSRMFDRDPAPATAISLPSGPEQADTPPAGAGDPDAGATPDDFAMPDLSGAIEAVRIGFAGQSYADAPDAQDGPGGAHGNLLHGLL